MKKIFDLGNNIKVEFENEEYKIISANGSVIRLDDEGEFLSCENTVAQKTASKKKEYLSKFKKISEEEQRTIVDWINMDISEAFYNTNKEFFVELEKAAEKVNYDFYVTLVLDTRYKITLLNDYKTILPKYQLERANLNEAILFTAYKLAIDDWKYEEIFENKDVTITVMNLMESLYVLKLLE